MDVIVFGLGYVGAVTAQLFTERGHRVVGLDGDPKKIAAISRGEAPVPENGLTAPVGYYAALHPEGPVVRPEDFSATVAVLCLPTPSGENGALDCSIVNRCADEAATMGVNDIVVRSTVMPGTCAKIAERTGRNVHYWPELMREGTALADARRPNVIMWGYIEDKSALDLAMAFGPLIEDDYGPQFVLSNAKEIELAKLSANAWRATKVSFANEIGSIARSLGVDGRRVMSAVMEDKKLSTSALYTQPGGPWGGSCLPKDLRALCSIRAPWINSVLVGVALSNEFHETAIASMVLRETNPHDAVVLIGMSFKAGTADLRDSPALNLAQHFRQSDRIIFHIDADCSEGKYLITPAHDEVAGPAAAYVFLKKDERVAENIVSAIAAGYAPLVVDCVGLDEPARFGTGYRGICW